MHFKGEDSKLVKIDDVASCNDEITSTELKDGPISCQSDSSDSVTFVSASTLASTSICASATQLLQKQRNIRSNHNSNESEQPRSRSRYVNKRQQDDMTLGTIKV